MQKSRMLTFAVPVHVRETGYRDNGYNGLFVCRLCWVNKVIRSRRQHARQHF